MRIRITLFRIEYANRLKLIVKLEYEPTQTVYGGQFARGVSNKFMNRIKGVRNDWVRNDHGYETTGYPYPDHDNFIASLLTSKSRKSIKSLGRQQTRRKTIQNRNLEVSSLSKSSNKELVSISVVKPQANLKQPVWCGFPQSLIWKDLALNLNMWPRNRTCNLRKRPSMYNTSVTPYKNFPLASHYAHNLFTS